MIFLYFFESFILVFKIKIFLDMYGLYFCMNCIYWYLMGLFGKLCFKEVLEGLEGFLE